MSTTTGCPIPGASQPKEPARLIDIKEILQYDGAHFIWSGGKNCLAEQKAAYARGYDAGMKFIVDEAKKAPTIDPESLRPTAHWISVKDRLQPNTNAYLSTILFVTTFIWHGETMIWTYGSARNIYQTLFMSPTGCRSPNPRR